MKDSTLEILGKVAMIGAGIFTILGSLIGQKQTDRKIAEAVTKALAEKK